MTIDKEYPATHSMSTSWYIVDDEGNVGIMDYDENGPVPWGIEETTGDDLKFGHLEDYRTGKLLQFNLTDEQILDLLHEPHKPSEETDWFNRVVKIDINKTDRFLQLCRNPDIGNDNVHCISEKLGLYEFETFIDDECQFQGTLKTIIDEAIIIEVYQIQSFFMSDKVENGKTVHEKEFDNSPYYMFHQPYSTCELPKKMHEPVHPVTIEQIPQEFRHRLQKIPGKFKVIDTFQIAQYYPCNLYSNCDPSYMVDGSLYITSPLPDGNKIYVKTTMCEYDFLPYCPEREKYHCLKCTYECLHIEDSLIADTPTVLIVFDPREQIYDKWKIPTDIILQKSYAIPYIPVFPHKMANFSCVFEDDVKKFMTHKALLRIFAASKGHFEKIIDDLKPRVILATNNALDVLISTYKADTNNIDICGTEYPFYKMASLDNNRSTVEELAKLSYRGTKHPNVISIDEMENLVRRGVAKEPEDTL